METHFIKMEETMQDKLAYFRRIFGQPEHNWDIDIIGFRYTIPEKGDPYEEKIRNIRVSLAGKWKMVYLIEIYGVEKSNEAFDDFHQKYNRSHSGYNLYLRSLFAHHKAKDFSVKARNFNEGVNALFEMATKEYPSDKELLEFRLQGITNYKSLPILILQTGEYKTERYDAFTWCMSDLKKIETETRFRPMYSVGA